MNGKLGIFEMMVADDKKSATVRMRGIVAPRYWEGQQNTIAAVDVVKALEDLPESVETLRVIVNSRGGSVSEGVEIYEALNDFKGKVFVEVHGMAASIASLILCAGEERKISKQGQVMIHQPTVYAGGNAKDLKAAVQSLENITEQMLDAYEENTTLSRDELREAMEATTFYKAADAVKFGFCTGVLERSGGESEEDFDGAGESNLIELKPEQLQHLEKHGWQEAAFAEIFELNKGPDAGSATKEDDMKLDFKLMGTLKGIFGAEKALELAEENQEATCLADFDEALKAHCDEQAKAVEEATAKLKEAEEAKATFEAENAALKMQVTDLGKAPVVVDMTGDPSEPEGKGGNNGPVLTGEALAKDQWEKNVNGIREEFGGDETAFLAWAKSEDYPAEL